MWNRLSVWLGIVLVACISFSVVGCPPLASTFKIKFINTGTHPVIGAYLVPVMENAEPADWGYNLLPVESLTDNELKPWEYVVLDRDFAKGKYWMMVEFLVDGEVEYYHRDEFIDYHMSTLGLPEEYVTWHADRTSFDNGGESVGTGYTWGWSEYEYEIDVTPLPAVQ